jgi:hypothetical protein
MYSKKVILTGVLAILIGMTGFAYASHSWGSYHWGRTANPLTLRLADNVAANWDPYLATASADWTLSSVLDTVVVPGTNNPKNCRATNGRVEVCSSKYGNTGWLGIASVWASGNHIVQGTVKLNDTYFNTAKYNTPAWRQLVTCQEIGHTFGLDHQDENFSNANLGSCMDYTNDPSTNQHLNAHDYEQLEAIYAHLDSSNTSAGVMTSSGADIDTSNPSEWGRAIRTEKHGKPSLFERNLGNGQKVFTFVTWAE